MELEAAHAWHPQVCDKATGRGAIVLPKELCSGGAPAHLKTLGFQNALECDDNGRFVVDNEHRGAPFGYRCCAGCAVVQFGHAEAILR